MRVLRRQKMGRGGQTSTRAWPAAPPAAMLHSVAPIRAPAGTERLRVPEAPAITCCNLIKDVQKQRDRNTARSCPSPPGAGLFQSQAGENDITNSLFPKHLPFTMPP